MVFHTSTPFPKTFLIVLFVFLHTLVAAWKYCPAAVRPLTDKTVAAFYEHGRFDPHQISEDKLYESIKAAYNQETDADRLRKLAGRLLRLKWRRLWEANFEMTPETVVVSDPLARYFQPSDNWQWTEPFPHPERRSNESERLHYSVPANGTASHGVKGTFPYILPANGTLIQEVYLPDDHIPDQILLRIETGNPDSSDPQRPVFVQARWTKNPENHFATENRPKNFWAGTFMSSIPLLGDPVLSLSKGVRGGSPSRTNEKQPLKSTVLENKGGWRTLAVNLVDLGLCGKNRTIRGIEYIALGGEAWFGQTIIRRPPVEIRGAQKYHLFSEGDELTFDISVHNFSRSEGPYTLDLTVSDYQGSELLRSAYKFDIPGKTRRHEKLVVNPGKSRYLVFEYTLNREGNRVYHGYSSAAIIVPNNTGRKPHTKFGMMYWDQPGKDMVELYEKLGVKLIVIFPETNRLHLFDSQKFDVMPMFWALPERSPKEGAKLRKDLQPYLKAGQRIFSNFWETDLRVPPEIFAPNMRKFSQLVKQVEPAALVGIGGLAWFNVAYLSRLLQVMEDSRAFFDFIAVMLYNTPSPPEYSGIIQETEALKTLLKAHGKPEIEIWNVEWSYFENLNLDGGYWLNTGVPREYIAPYTIRHHLLGFASGIARMVPGTNLYVGRTPLAKNYGHSMTLGRSSVTRYDLSPLPLLPAYSVMTRMLEGKKYVRSIGQHPNVVCQVYRAVDDSYKALAGSKTVLVVWSLFGNEDIALTLLHDHDAHDIEVSLINMVGEKTEHTTYNGELHLSVTPEPMYVLLDEDMTNVSDAAEISFAEPLFSAEPEQIDITPGKDTVVKLTYHLFNSGNRAVQGRIKLIRPNWLTVARKEILYQSEIGKQFASQIFSGSESTSSTARITDEIWLGREHRVDVVYELLFPKEIKRKTYYEQTELTQQPAFQIVAEFVSDQNVLARTTTPVRALPPLRVSLRPVLSTKNDVNTPNVQVRIENTSLIPREGSLRMKVPGGVDIRPQHISFAVLPGKTQTYDFSLKGMVGFSQSYTHEIVDTRLRRQTEEISMQQNQPAYLAHYRRSSGYVSSFGVGEGYVIEALIRDQSGYETRQSRGFAFRPAVKATHAIVIDGQLDDWKDAAPLFVHPKGRLSGLTFFAKDYGGEMQWTGLDDFSSAWQMMWDKSFLYLAVRVFDDQFVPQHNLGQFRNGDSISFQIDPLPNLTDASPLPDQRDLQKIHTFTLGLSQEGPTFYRKYPSTEKRIGIVKTAKVAIKQESDGIIYELAIPWDELVPLRPENGDWVGFSLVLSEDDGVGRETRCNWFGGSGGDGLAREPRLMGDVHFVQ